MSAQSSSLPPLPGGPGSFRIFASALGSLLKALFVPLFLGLCLLQLLTPSLNYNPKNLPKTYTSASPFAPIDVAGSAGQVTPAQRVKILTADYRQLQVDYLTGQPKALTRGKPLTIIIAPFMTERWLLERVTPRADNVVVAYAPPRARRASAPYWPTAEMLTQSKTLPDYWNILATNPINKLYSLYRLPHEAPGDLVDIILWAQDNLGIDSNRINLVGLGSGTLVAAAAAHHLQMRGRPVHALALVYPPANLTSALKDNLIHQPRWLRKATAPVLNLLFFRLHLSAHLSKITKTPTLLVLPKNSYDLATYAAEPSIPLAGAEAETVYVDAAYRGYYDTALATQVRDAVGRWLQKVGGVGAY